MFNFNLKSPVISAVLLFSLSSCAVYNTDLDRKIGANNAQQVELQMGLYAPVSLDQYVKDVGQRLVEQIEKPEFTFQFSIVDDPQPNAFALPGGYIYISRGLLALMQTEDELANVLAHEIIHVTERHSVKQMRSGILPSLIELPGNLVGGILNENLGNLINAPISAGNDLLLSGYGRGHETESDTKGVALAAKAGYDPQQMTNILIRLNDAVELTSQQKTEKSYFDSHPFTPDRVKNINKVVSGITSTANSETQNMFITHIDGLLYGENPAKGFFVEQQFLHPDMAFVIDFPEDWQLLNQPQAVLAVDKTQQAFIALSTTNNNKNALENVTAFQQQAQKEFGQHIDYETVSFAWGGIGYAVNLQDKRQKEIANIDLLWVDINGLTYQVASMATDQFKQQVTLSSYSLRPMLASELNATTQQVIQIVEAQQGDTLESIAVRYNNVVSLDYLALINALQKSKPIQANQKVKLVTKEPYTSLNP